MIVAISGSFDPLHIGHLRHIQDAIKKGDKLFVILTSNQQCIHKKGICLIDYNERKELTMGYLRENDEVVPNIDDDLTCAKSLEYYRPDIFCKGGDRDSIKTLPINEVDVCQRLGIQIVFGSGGNKIQSSSDIIRKVREDFRQKVFNKLYMLNNRFGYTKEVLDIRDILLKEIGLL